MKRAPKQSSQSDNQLTTLTPTQLAAVRGGDGGKTPFDGGNGGDGRHFDGGNGGDGRHR